MRKLRVTFQSPVNDYQIIIGRNLLGSVGDHVRRLLGAGSRRVIIVSDERVFGLYGRTLIGSLATKSFEVANVLVNEGEPSKTLRTLMTILNLLSELRFERNDAVIALGGGIVGDLAGFAAATYLRGVPYFQTPTTLLAQIDSSVGGKTGVNLATGKNLVGAFYQPRGVFIDAETLTTLPARELTAGWCEMVKNGAVGSRELFNHTCNFLTRSSLQSKDLEKLIEAHCSFKAGIVAGDEREEIGRADHRSRRILNFGHTVGHALEAVTRYRRFRHGEAVGYGMLVAGEISKLLGLLEPSGLELLRDAIALCGPLPRANDLDERNIMEAVSRDKKSVSGSIKWVLLEKIGKPRIVDGKEISTSLLLDALKNVLKN